MKRIYILKLYFACELDRCKSPKNCPNPNTENVEIFKTVCLEDGTQKAWTGRYESERHQGNGVYRCACCGHPLFPLKTKYDSGSGWPSFWSPYNDQSLIYEEDKSCIWCGTRIAVECGKCGIHLGHVFEDGPSPSNKRYCMNSVCLNYENENGTTWQYNEDIISIPEYGYTIYNLLILFGAVVVITLSICVFVICKKKNSSEGFVKVDKMELILLRKKGLFSNWR